MMKTELKSARSFFLPTVNSQSEAAAAFLLNAKKEGAKPPLNHDRLGRGPLKTDVPRRRNASWRVTR